MAFSVQAFSEAANVGEEKLEGAILNYLDL
jgi:hypothetical protein